MFLTGVVIGSILGTAVAVLALAAAAAGKQAEEDAAALMTASVVPLHVTRATLVSLN